MQVLTFIIICLVVYFIIVLPMNAALNRLYVSAVHTLQAPSKHRTLDIYVCTKCLSAVTQPCQLTSSKSSQSHTCVRFGDLQCGRTVILRLS
jgi:hypothetical protein